MSQDLQLILYNGSGIGPEGREGEAFSLSEQPIMLASKGLSAPVTLQVMQQETGLWFDGDICNSKLEPGHIPSCNLHRSNLIWI